MFAYRGILLAATISTASVVLADVLVQPGYEDNRHNPSYQSPMPQQQPLLLPEQYHARQLTDQRLIPHLRRAQAVYPIDGNQNYRSHYVGYPMHYYRHHPYILPHHLHYTKIGGHGYVRPSIFADYRRPVVGHYRYRRSAVHDATVEELAKPALVNRDKVATKSSLMATKYSTVIDSHLQENEPTGTDNKALKEKRQSENDQVTTGPSLFGLYPQNMYRGSRQLNTVSKPEESSDISIRSNVERNSDASKHPTKKSTTNFPTTFIVRPVPETTLATSQGTGLEDSKNQEQNQTPLTNTNQLSSSASISPSNKAPDEESASVGAGYNYHHLDGKESEWPIMSPGIYTPLGHEIWNVPSLYNPIYARNFPDPRPSHVSWKFDPSYQQKIYRVSDKKSSPKLRNKYNKERLKNNQLVGASNLNSDYRAATFCNPPGNFEYPSVYNVIPVEMHDAYEPITYPVDLDYYATYKGNGVQNNPAPTTDVVQILPYMSQFPNTYDDPVNTRYVSLPNLLSLSTYYPLQSLTYDTDTAPQDAFSSPTYY